jgi:hypothetical protein
MSAPRRLLALALCVGVVAAVTGCGGSSNGVPDSKIRSALQMKSIQGHLAIEGNPFCSTSKILNDASEVRSVADKSGLVIASRNHTIGVEIVKPFAPGCRNFAERKLDKLARGPKKKHRKGGGGGN